MTAPRGGGDRADDVERSRGAGRWAVALVVGVLVVAGATRLARPVDREMLVPEPTGYRLSINIASAGELEALPGVGPALASAIVAHRDVDGPFANPAALQAVSGIGPKTAARVELWVAFETKANR
ncbi:MAG: helix-hairpin-helix domain-containing protein [Planctomycetota bacterium]